MEESTDKISLFVLPDEQLQDLLKYTKSPWFDITKMAIIEGTNDILICYTDILGTTSRKLIKYKL